MTLRASALLFCAVAFLATAVSAQSDVVDAKDATFDSIIAGHSFVMVEFYAPWCGHCKKLEPEYEKAATALKGVAVLAKVDATVEKEVAQKFEIRGFPTIKIFRDGLISGDYEGGRTSADMIKYVKGNVGPAVTDVTTGAELQALKASNSVVVTLFSAEENAVFTTVAKALRSSATFVRVASADAFGGEAAGSIVLFKQFDEGREVCEDATEAGIRSCVQNGSIKVFDEMGPDNYKSYMTRGLPIAWLFVVPMIETDKSRENVAAVAKDFKGKLSFVWIDAAKYGSMAQRLGLKGDEYPALAIDHESVHFMYEKKPFTTDAIRAFVQDYVNGKLTATIRSEEPPSQATNEKGLTTVTGATFDSLVAKSDKDVMIEFYAPWCGHCKSLKPIYEQVAEHFNAVEHVTIAMIDATANDYDQKAFPVQGFPTLFFVPNKEGRHPVPYDGPRTRDGIVEFINQHTTKPIDGAKEDL